MNMSDKIKKNEHIAFRVIEEEGLLVDPKDGFIYPLNTVATRIWLAIDGTNTVGNIIEKIDKEFEGEKSSLKGDVGSFMADLMKAGLAGVV